MYSLKERCEEKEWGNLLFKLASGTLNPFSTRGVVLEGLQAFEAYQTLYGWGKKMIDFKTLMYINTYLINIFLLKI